MSSGLIRSSFLEPGDWSRSAAKSMANPFGARSWLWVMAHINFLYAQTFAKRSGRMWVTQWPYPWRNGSDKFLQQLRRDLQGDDHSVRRILANHKYRLVALASNRTGHC